MHYLKITNHLSLFTNCYMIIKTTVTPGSILMTRNIYFKNWKNKNKPTNIVLVYHTKIYFNVAMWVFVSLWLQCEAVWKAGWARKPTDTEEERQREVNKQYLDKNTNKHHPRCIQFSFEDTWNTIKVDLSLFFVCCPMKSALPRRGRSDRTQLKSELNTDTCTQLYWK